MRQEIGAVVLVDDEVEVLEVELVLVDDELEVVVDSVVLVEEEVEVLVDEVVEELVWDVVVIEVDVVVVVAAGQEISPPDASTYA